MLLIRKIWFFQVLFVLALLVTCAVAQDSSATPPPTGPPLPTDFDWSQFGVSTGVIIAIITVVQLFKKYIPEQFVVFAPILLAVGAFFILGGDQPKENMFYWAAAAAYLWKMANKITPQNILKTKDDIG